MALKIGQILKKIATFLVLTVGMLLGLCCAFFFITFLLRSQHIKISLAHLSGDTQPPRDTAADFQSPSSKRPFYRRHSRSSGNLINLDKINNPDELMKLALGFLQDEDFYYAEEALIKLRKLKPDYPDLYWQLGKCYEGEDNTEEAIKNFYEYKKSQNPDHGKLLYIANFFITDKKCANAMEFIEEAQKLKDSPEAHYLTARCLYLKSNYKKAIDECTLTLEYDKNYPDVLELLAECQIKTGKKDKAVEAYQEAYRLDPRPYFLQKIVALKSELGDYKGAKSALNDYILTETDPAKIEEAKAQLKTLTLNAMKTIPEDIGNRTDVIPNVSLVGIIKSDDTSQAYLTVDGVNQEIQEGDTILTDYYVLKICDNYVVLVHDEDYVVLRSL